MVSKSIEADVKLLDHYHEILLKLEQQVLEQARVHDPVALGLLRTIPGIGKILALVMIYEIDDITRFQRIGNFISYCRLVKPAHESAGKKHGSKNSKIGNVHLKWAFSEAACLFLRGNKRAKEYHERLVSKYGKAKALSIIAQKLGRTVYIMLKRQKPYDPNKFNNNRANSSHRCTASDEPYHAAQTACSTMSSFSRFPAVDYHVCRSRFYIVFCQEVFSPSAPLRTPYITEAGFIIRTSFFDWDDCGYCICSWAQKRPPICVWCRRRCCTQNL